MTKGGQEDRRHLDLGGAELRVRRERGSRDRIVGYAAIFNSPSNDLGGFVEVLEPGAFRDALETSDVVALFNHDKNNVLGSQRSGSLTLEEDDRGLRFEVTPPNTSTAKDVMELIRSGDITGNSFSFRVAEDGDEVDTNSEPRVRRIKPGGIAKVFDVGPVTFPAYESTEVSARSARSTGVSTRSVGLPDTAGARCYGDSCGRRHRTPRSRAQGVSRHREQARRIALHEAGHAVIALLEGAGVIAVKLRFDEKNRPVAGACWPMEQRLWSPEISAAGEVAEEIAGFDGSRSHVTCAGDREDVSSRVRCAPMEAPWRAVQRTKRDVRQTLVREWNAVEAVANELLSRFSLSGDRVEEIVKRHASHDAVKTIERFERAEQQAARTKAYG